MAAESKPMPEPEPATGGAPHGKGPSAEGGAPPPPSAEQVADLRKKAAERDEIHGRMLRALADYQNLARRLDRERSDVELEKTRLVLSAFLGPLDDLRRLAMGLPASADPAFREGVQIVLKGFQKAMRECGLEEVEAEGLPFDPAVHEAVGREARPGVPMDQVLSVAAPGYRHRGRLLRPARVILAGSQGSGEREEGPEQAQESGR